MSRKKFKLLFMCTGNQARSQIAEALLKSKAGDRFEVLSAGSMPGKRVHPMALKVLGEKGIDATGARPKSVSGFLNRKLDYVITLCDNARDTCPVFPGQPVSAHWNLEDPAAFEGSEDEKLSFFRKTRDEIERCIDLLLDIPLEELSPEEAVRRMNSIKA